MSSVTSAISERTVGAVNRAVHILDILTASPEGRSLVDISQALNVAPQTVLGILRTLQDHDLVTQAGPRRPYVLGPQVLRWARQWQAEQSEAGLARPIVEELADALNENVLLLELRGEHLHRIVVIELDQALSVKTEHLLDASIHALATGKVLLAYLPVGQQDRMLERLTLEPYTPKTITSTTALRRQLDAIKGRGYALSCEEVSPGVAAVAVPIFDHHQTIRAALGSAMPLVRFEAAEIEATVEHLQRAAEAIQAAWG